MTDQKARALSLYLVYFILIRMVLCEMSPEAINELCQDYGEIEIIPYPGKPNKFILCVENTSISDTSECGGECPGRTNSTCINGNCSDPPTTATDDISYEAAKTFCESAPILEKVAMFDCRNYYICAGPGKDPITVTCPGHQHYSKYKEICTSPLEAYCSPPQHWCDNQPDGLRFAAAKCFQYYECSSGMTTLKSCPYNQYFNVDNNECVLGVCKLPNGSTSERKPNCADYAEGVFLIHLKCYQYYVCVKNNVYEGQCSPGFYFQPQTRFCVRDVNSTCNHNEGK